MNKIEAKKILGESLGNYIDKGSELLFRCPSCNHHKRKFSVNLDKNVFKCWICDYIGKDIGRLVYSYGTPENKRQWKVIAGVVDFSELDEKEEKLTVTLPEEFITLTGKKVKPLSIPARKYLKERNLTRSDLVWWKIGYCPDGEFEKRIIIPSFDLSGSVDYFIARSYTSGSWQKYKNPPSEKDFIFNELYLDWNSGVTIVEGVFDAMVAGNAIPLLGSTLRENSYVFQKILDNCQEIYIALDADATEKELKIGKLFMSYGVDVYRIDTSGFGDIGEMDKETFQTRKKTATFLSLDNYLVEKLSF